MAYFDRDEAQINASYNRRNVACGVLAFHAFLFMMLACAFSTSGLWQSVACFWGMALLAHTGFVWWYSRRERQIRKAYGEHVVSVPVYAGQPPTEEKPKRKSGFIQAADGTFLEVVDDEPSTLNLDDVFPPKRKRGEDE